jgi:hypothetical protein
VGCQKIFIKNKLFDTTDAVKKYILPQSDYVKQTEWLAYADEADILNVALFGCTAKQWRQANEELAKKII